MNVGNLVEVCLFSVVANCDVNCVPICVDITFNNILTMGSQRS